MGTLNSWGSLRDRPRFPPAEPCSYGIIDKPRFFDALSVLENAVRRYDELIGKAPTQNRYDGEK